MITDKIIEQFNKTQAKILFLFDEDGEHESELESYVGDDFRCIVVQDNYFTIKYEIEILYKDKCVLLYHKCLARDVEKNIEYPLMDLLLANKEIRIDESSEFLSRYKIDARYGSVLLKHKKWLSNSRTEKKLIPFLVKGNALFDEVKFENAVLSLIIGTDDVGSKKHNLINSFLEMVKGEDHWEKKKREIEKQRLTQVFLTSLTEETSIVADGIDYLSLKAVFQQLKYNGITGAIKNRGDQYANSLKIDSAAYLASIDAFFRTWSNSKMDSQLEIALSILGEQINEDYLINYYGANQEYGLMTKRSKELLVRGFYAKVLEIPNDFYEEYKNWSNQMSDYDGAENEMDFMVNAAGFLKKLKNYIDFDFNCLKDYVVKYQGELYELDLMYRHAYTAYQRIKDESKTETCIKLYVTLNKTYDQYLIDLNVAWIKILEEKKFDFNSIDFNKQYNFYRDYISGSDSKKVVIISDAFRYELGVDLKNELDGDTKNSIVLEAMLSSVPSYTNLGMSNLLPNKGIVTEKSEGSIDYSIDGIKTVSSNREKILKLYNENSIVTDYRAFMELSVEAQRGLLKGKGVVYIYHNWMDAIGDSKVSEHYTFQSAEECINQLSGLIKRLYTSLNSYSIIVTADHGFLFNVTGIEDNSRQEFPDVTGTLKEHTRFCITDGSVDKKNSYSFPLSNSTNIISNEQVIIPKAINRFRKKGNFGVQFVHGGCSLQEVIVPVFSLSRKKEKKVLDVEFSFLKESITISSYEFKFDILQSEEVGEKYNASKLVFGIYDKDNNLLSNAVNIELNSTAKSPTDRVYSIPMKIMGDLSNIRSGFIIAYNIKDTLNPIKKVPVRISILTEKDDF